MKPVLVHIHVYYTEQWPDLHARLAKLHDFAFDVWVTYCGADCGFEEQVAADAPAAHVLQVANVGYDIAPFVEVLKQVNLEDYSYCIKLHSKRNMPDGSLLGAYDVGGDIWRKLLLSFVEPCNFSRCLAAFKVDATLGMVGHHALIWRREPDDKSAWREAVQLLESTGLPYRNPAFVAGTMFMCRAALLKPLVSILGSAEFEPANREKPTSMAHVAERLLGFVITAQGYSVMDVYTPARERLLRWLRGMGAHLRRFMYQRKVTRKGKLIIKICRIPVYSAKSR